MTNEVKDLSGEALSSFVNEMMRNISDLVHSNDVNDKIAGLMAVEELMDIDFEEKSSVITTISNYLRLLVQNNHDQHVLLLASRAVGRFDGFFEYNLYPWDVAAGALIVQRAGGTVTDFKGKNDYLFGRQIAAANEVHEEMLQLVNRYF